LCDYNLTAYLFSIKSPVLVKICPTVTKILTSNKWSSKVYRFHQRAFLLTVNEVNGHQHRRNCRIDKPETVKWCLAATRQLLGAR